ncbi:uncharacterized protein STEHIDRAFT_132540 [Stereum hirsutum FP-91666 SS1]|uniref:uncharacterized protein n=1 Tax=Stereum hirsutum (strain FP-91666) TaxID=721885 RepID=UPI0004449C3D|nr:uncharacterized protein STEHIDRAFT_132540 [Stereum hirsutum FP-91666 SS1]EIM85066.1 hypothetical protein STEHIDRAFT_132540 [Stereum hirsutum FP-91666 SS1]
MILVDFFFDDLCFGWDVRARIRELPQATHVLAVYSCGVVWSGIIDFYAPVYGDEYGVALHGNATRNISPKGCV